MKKISLPDLGWFFILLCYAGSFLFLLISGKVYDFLHPRMLIFTIGAVVVLFVMAGCFIFKVIKGFSAPSLKKGFLIFIIPLLLGYAAGNIDTGTALARAGGEGIGETLNPDAFSKEYSDEDVRELLNRKVIEIEDESYYRTQFILYENAELFSGKEINVMGFIYRDDDFEQDIFLQARYIMWCCAADAVLTGYISEYKNIEELKPERWSIVSGTLGVTSYYDSNKGKQVKIPRIIVNRISYVDPPSKKYIFVE